MQLRLVVRLLGPLAEKLGVERLEARLPVSEATARDVIGRLCNLLPQICSGGEPAPGYLVFINGRDWRVYEEGDRLSGEVMVDVVQVLHAG